MFVYVASATTVTCILLVQLQLTEIFHGKFMWNVVSLLKSALIMPVDRWGIKCKRFAGTMPSPVKYLDTFKQKSFCHMFSAATIWWKLLQTCSGWNVNEESAERFQITERIPIKVTCPGCWVYCNRRHLLSHYAGHEEVRLAINNSKNLRALGRERVQNFWY